MSDIKEFLLLIHPAVTTLPELLEAVKEYASKKNMKMVNQYLIDKVVNDISMIGSCQYDIIIYLTPEEEDKVKFPDSFISVLYDTLKQGGKFYGLGDKFKLTALLNGFQITNEDSAPISTFKNCWTKQNSSNKPLSVSLETGRSSLNKSTLKSTSGKKLPSFKKKTSGTNINIIPITTSSSTTNLVNYLMDFEDIDTLDSDSTLVDDKLKYFKNMDIDDTDAIEEDSLMDKHKNCTGSDAITTITCRKSKTKAKKACKDCSCGLKTEEEENIDSIRSTQSKVIKFTKEEITEIDFTVEGKKLGGCGSCSLGDAFRCTGCPYLGLPAFKPGQAVNLTSIIDDL